MERRPDNDLPLRAGDVVAGKYRVEHVLGRGGMGFVMAARHVHLGTQVAIKLLLPGAPVGADAFERFLREGRLAARIRSEHVARVHDAGVLETGVPYLVLEYLEGLDLRALLRKRGKMPVDTAVVYVLQVCEALAEAHSLGIVHRDLKPGNLFLTRRADGSEVVKVIDFGISKVTSRADEIEVSTLTGRGAAIGTPTYMAPEQMRSARSADPRADIWSLGAVLYGLLTGSSPFAGETIIDVYDRILKGAPSLRAARDDVPAELDEIVRRCLRFDPAERYEDVGQLAAVLAEVAPAEGRLSAARAIRIVRGPVTMGETPAEEERDGERSLDDAERASSRDAPRAMAEASIDVSGRATTEITREPSWVHRVESGPPPAAQGASARRPSADRRTAMLVFTGSLVLAIGGAAIGYASGLRSPPSPRPTTTAPIAADHEPPAPSAAAPLVSPAPLPPPAAPPSATSSASASPTPPAPTTRPRDGSRSASPRPAPTARATAAPAPPRVQGLAEAPD